MNNQLWMQESRWREWFWQEGKWNHHREESLESERLTLDNWLATLIYRTCQWPQSHQLYCFCCCYCPCPRRKRTKLNEKLLGFVKELETIFEGCLCLRLFQFRFVYHKKLTGCGIFVLLISKLRFSCDYNKESTLFLSLFFLFFVTIAELD